MDHENQYSNGFKSNIYSEPPQQPRPFGLPHADYADDAILRRIWGKCDVRSNGCLIWKGKQCKGSPTLRIGRKNTGVVRLLYFLKCGKKPHRLFSTCGNQLCVNPEHRASEQPRLTWLSIYERLVIKRGDSECWDTIAPIMKSGYWRLRFAGKEKSAHRFAFELYHGPILQGFVIRHICHNKRCTNPNHLEMGTARDNNLDTKLHGKNRVQLVRGEKHGNAKRPDADLVIIFQMFYAGVSRSVIAKQFKISEGYVTNLVNGRTSRTKHLPFKKCKNANKALCGCSICRSKRAELAEPLKRLFPHVYADPNFKPFS